MKIGDMADSIYWNVKSEVAESFCENKGFSTSDYMITMSRNNNYFGFL